MTTNQEDAPFGVFRLGYSLFVWGNVALLTVIMVWVFWTMFMNTPSGTLSTERLAAAMPTREAVRKEVQTRLDPFACQKTDVTVCTACHLIDGGGNEVCPSLLEIVEVSNERIADAAYGGAATTVRDYILESIVDPNAYLVESPEGKNYSAGGNSVMPAGLDQQVDLEAVVEYLYCAGGGKEITKATAEAGGTADDAAGGADEAASDEGDGSGDDADSASDEAADGGDEESEDADTDAGSEGEGDSDEESSEDEG